MYGHQGQKEREKGSCRQGQGKRGGETRHSWTDKLVYRKGYGHEGSGEEHPTHVRQCGEHAGERKTAQVHDQAGQEIEGDEENKTLQWPLGAYEPDRDDGASPHTDEMGEKAKDKDKGKNPGLDLLATEALEVDSHCASSFYTRGEWGGSN